MLDKVRKQIVGSIEYTFKMTNRTIRKIDETYGNYGDVIYGIMEGQQFYTNALKLISMCCMEKEWTIDELENEMSAEQYQSITLLAVDLYLDYMGLNEEEKEEKEEDKKK